MAQEILFRDILAKLVEKKDMAPDEAAAAMNTIMGGNATPAQAGAFLAALRMKGETAEEIAGRPVMDESILGEIPKQEAVDAILKEIQDAVPKVSVDELKDTSKRRVPVEKTKDEPVPPV